VQFCWQTKLSLALRKRVANWRWLSPVSHNLAVSPQNLVDGTIVDVSTVGLELTYPDAPLGLRPFLRWNDKAPGEYRGL